MKKITIERILKDGACIYKKSPPKTITVRGRLFFEKPISARLKTKLTSSGVNVDTFVKDLTQQHSLVSKTPFVFFESSINTGKYNQIILRHATKNVILSQMFDFRKLAKNQRFFLEEQNKKRLFFILMKLGIMSFLRDQMTSPNAVNSEVSELDGIELNEETQKRIFNRSKTILAIKNLNIGSIYQYLPPNFRKK